MRAMSAQGHFSEWAELQSHVRGRQTFDDELAAELTCVLSLYDVTIPRIEPSFLTSKQWLSINRLTL